MRVLFIVHTVFGQLKGGGERYIVEAVKALRNQGVLVDVLAVTGFLKFQALQEDNTSQPISLKTANGFVRSCDLIHVHQLNSPGFDYGAIAAKWFRKPLVLTDHGGGWRNPGRVLGKLRLRIVDAGAFVSKWGAKDIDPAGLIPIHRVVSGGGDHLPEAKPLPRHYDFGFVGRILPHKGVHVIVQALPIGASLIIAGQPRDPIYMEEVRSLAEGKDVTFLSDAGDDVVASLFRSVRFLLIPSVFRYQERYFARPELMGIVALEAMSIGTPVIGSDVAGLGEVLRDAGQIVLPPSDVAAWHACLERVLREETPQVRSAAFTWDAVAKRCTSLYRELVGTIH